MRKVLDIVVASDDKFIPFLTVTLISLLETNRDIIGKIFLLANIKNKNKLKKSLDYIQKSFGVAIEVIFLNGSVFQHLKAKNHISHTTYNRLLLADIIPCDISSILYLDADILVIGDLSGLLKINFDDEDSADYYIYAVNHRYNKKYIELIEKTGINGSDYFNTGVMLVNLKKWRVEKLTSKFLEVAKKNDQIFLLHDQDILNFTFEKKWGELDYSYNVFGLNIRGVYEDELLSKTNEADYKIIHFISGSKPWTFLNSHPYKKMYWEYLNKSPFKKYIPDDIRLIAIVKFIKIKTRKIRYAIKENILGIK